MSEDRSIRASLDLPARNAIRSSILLIALLGGCAPLDADSEGAHPPAEADAGSAETRVAPGIRERIAGGESVDLIVLFQDGSDRVGALRAVEEDARSRPVNAHDERVASGVGGMGAPMVHYESFPMAALRVQTLGALDMLESDPTVERIYLDQRYAPMLMQSLPLIGQPAAAAAGFIGNGATVAVLDTGLDFTVSDFGTCPSPGAPGCKVVFARDFAPNDGMRDRPDMHGTNVSAIVLGVAPGARVAALDVVSSDGYAHTTHLLAAIDWVIANRATYGIVALNLSLGAGAYTERCATDPLSPAIGRARQEGLLSAIASGNDGRTDAVSSPGCVPGAVIVGAVYDSNFGAGWCGEPTAADRVACFSNSAPFMDLFAPGASITAGGTTGGGTSQATPHVAGAIAVLRAGFPAESVDQTLTRLTANGVIITDLRSGLRKPRLHLGAAVGDCVASVSPTDVEVGSKTVDGSVRISARAGCSWQASSNASWITLTGPVSGTTGGTIRYRVATNDRSTERSGTLTVARRTVTITQAGNEPPTGERVTIAGDAPVTGGRDVPLTLFATDPDGVASMCISNSPACVQWMPYATSVPWTLTGGSGVKTVRVWFRDPYGNATRTAAVDTIVLDQSPPSAGAVSINGGATATTSPAVNLTISGADDSGIASMCISNTAACSAWIPFSATRSWTLAGGSGPKLVRVWLRDSYGNATPEPASASIRLVLENGPMPIRP